MLFLLLCPMELLRTTGSISWFGGHSQMPLSWPKPLRWVVHFQGLLPVLVFWTAALGPFRPCPAVQTPRNSLFHPYSPFRHNCISETPTYPFSRTHTLGATTPSHPPILTSQFLLEVRSPWFWPRFGPQFPPSVKRRGSPSFFSLFAQS